MGIFKRKPKYSEIKTYSTADLATIVEANDIVEVVETESGPILLATPKTSKSNSGLAMYDRELQAVGPIHYGTFNEPTHAERSAGRPVVPLPGAVTATTVRLSDVAGGNTQDVAGRSPVDLNELGTSSPSPWVNFARREYNTDLLGLRGLETYDKMRRNDGIVRGTLRSVKTPVLSGRWFITPCDKDKTADVNAANWVWDNLQNGMSISFTQVLTEALLMADFGYYMFEIVWTEDPPSVGHPFGMYKVQKLAPRHPMDVKQWSYDAQGGPNGAWFYASEYGGADVFIPINKLLVFTFDREAGSMEGISLLRSAYKHWYFKEQLYKIDAIQKERHGIGIPVVILPVGFDENDKRVAEAIGRNLRTNERAHVTLPPMWEIKFAELQGQVVSSLDSIKLHDNAIRENILLQFMDGNTNASGDDEKTAMFYKATRFIADIVLDVFNLELLPKMIDANFARVGYPKIKVRRIGESQDWRTLSFAIRNLIGANLLVADDKLEAWIRDEMDMPEKDEATARPLVTPGDSNTPKQSGQSAGLPRQGAPASKPPRSNGGRDSSGG